MKLAFVLAAWAVAAVSGTIYVWGLAAHFEACREFSAGVRDAVLMCLCIKRDYDYWRSGWYDLGAAIIFAITMLTLLVCFVFSLIWATL